LVELVYDSEKRKTGLTVSRFGGLWNIEQEVEIDTGEILVPYAASNNLIANDCVLLPSRPVEYGFKHELLADIRAFLHRYVDLSPIFMEIAAHYVLLSWVYDRFNEVPYLRLRGEYGTGKTRALTAIGSLCYKPFFASGASTVSPIFHTLDAFGGTLILDEADLPFSDARAELVKILNNGNMRGMPVLRSVQNRHKEFNPSAFKVFGPKIIAMRESFEDKALESRFLTEETGARPLRHDIPIHLPDSLKIEALELRNRLLHFRLCEFFKIETDSSALTAGIEPRLNQITLPLLSLVDDQGLRGQMQSAFLAQNENVLAARRETAEAGVVVATLAAFVASGSRDVSVGDIAGQFNIIHGPEIGQLKSSKWIGYMLRTRLRLSIQKSRGIYVVPVSEKTKIDALCHRHGISAADLPNN